jgi:hypothetical protein
VQPSSNGTLFLVIIVLVALAAGGYFLFGSSDDASNGSPGASDGIAIVGQLPAGRIPTPARPAQQPQTAPQQSGGDQVVTVNMQFTQTLVRTEGRCPANVPAAGFDLSARAPTKVTINKTKRTIQIENSDGTKSDLATYDAVTGLALITFQGAQDNRTSTVRVTDQALDGESSFFPYRGRQGGEQYSDCKFVLKTLAKVV